MKTKPMYFNLMGALFLIMAASLPLQIWMIYRVNDVNMILSKMTYLNWILVALFCCTSFLCFKVSKAILFLVPLTCAVVCVNNAVVASYGNDFSFGQTLFASISFVILCSTFYSPKISQVLMDTKNRWWEPAPRYKKSLPVQIIFDKNQINGLSFDISESGIFVQQDPVMALNNIAIGQVIKLQIELPHGTLNCSAEVVRKTQLDEGNYPAGLGFRFIDPSAYLKQTIQEEFATATIH